MNNWDVIIVGGGPGGSTAGHLLARKGLNVLLIEKEKFPREKLCAGGLTEKTVKLLDDIFDESVESLIKANIINYQADSWKILYKKKLVDVFSKELYFVDRSVYDEFFLNKALDSGVKLIENEKVVKVDPEKNLIFTSKNIYHSKFIIGADGVFSVVRKSFPETLFSHNKWIQRLIMTMEGVLPREVFNRDITVPELYFGITKYGYGWVFPNKDRLVIGIGSSFKNENIRELFYRFIHLLGVNPERIHPKGYPLPSGDLLIEPAYRNILLVGDAGGMVNPITGEGIYYAHKSGQLAAKAIWEVIARRESVSAIYKTYLKKSIYKRINLDGKLKWIIFFLLNLPILSTFSPIQSSILKYFMRTREILKQRLRIRANV